MREVTIRPVLNGWKVQVGCREVVFMDKILMLSALSKYIDNPTDVEKEYLDKARNYFPVTDGATGVEAARAIHEE